MNDKNFVELTDVARNQNCVLEREPSGYFLYSNTNFVGGEFYTLTEVQVALETESNFQ